MAVKMDGVDCWIHQTRIKMGTPPNFHLEKSRMIPTQELNNWHSVQLLRGPQAIIEEQPPET